jgi:hypothetical protein
MFFWVILIITSIVFLSIAWLVRPHLLPLLKLTNRPKSIYWLIWLLVAVCLSISISVNQFGIILVGWIVLMILLIGLSYLISRNFSPILPLFLLIISIGVLSWIIIEAGVITPSACLLIPALIWLVILFVSLLKHSFFIKST